jgi:hypothetical protein
VRCKITASSRVFALPSCRYGPESRSPHNGGRFAALGLLGRVVGDEERSPIEDGRRAGGRGGVIPRNSTTRSPAVEGRRRVEEQEKEHDHRKDPGFARPITLATTSSFGVGVLCEYFARFSFASFRGAVNRYNSHIVYIDVLNEVSVMPARGAQSC